MGKNPKIEDQFSEQETARRRDAVIKRMLNTPPKPHSEMRVGKSSGKKTVSPKPRASGRKLSRRTSTE